MITVGVGHDRAIAGAAGIDEHAGSDQVDSVVEIEHGRSISSRVVSGLDPAEAPGHPWVAIPFQAHE